MKVTAKIVANFEDEGRLKAISTVCLDGKFLITGVRIVDGEKGLVVFMPSRKTANDEYKDICFPIKPELHKQIKETVLAAYADVPEQNEPAHLTDEPLQVE